MIINIILVVALVGVVLLSPRLHTKISSKRKKKVIRKLREQWGVKVKLHKQDIHLSRMFHNLKVTIYSGNNVYENSNDEHLLTDSNISDLDINNLFENLDNTHSKVGEQYLYYRLCRLQLSTSFLSNFESKIERYNSIKSNREEVQYLLLKLNEYGAYFLPQLFLGKKKQIPKWHWVTIVLSVLSVTCLIGVFFDLIFLFGVMFFFATNLAVHYWNKGQMVESIRSFSELKTLIKVAREIQQFEVLDKDDFDVSKLDSMTTYLNLIQTEERFLDGGIGDAIWSLLEYVKIYFLLEINAYFRCLKFIEDASDTIEEMYMYVGEIDAAISVANFRLQLPYYTDPDFTENKKEIIAEDVFHPLIKNCIANSVQVQDKSMLITGSNMSGKTTYIRAMAINAILSQTINTSISKKYIAPFFKIGTSIRIQDDIENGKSYFFEEVVRIGELVSGVDDKSVPHLFIIDEVFKGTNTKERVAASRAILSYLNQYNNIVMVATHDLELVTMLDDQFDLYHFEENVVDGKLMFDHKIKEGPLKTTNAITLLEVVGYPKEITQQARDLLS